MQCGATLIRTTHQTLERLDVRANWFETAIAISFEARHPAFNLGSTYSADQYSATANMFSRPCTCRAVFSCIRHEAIRTSHGGQRIMWNAQKQEGSVDPYA